MSLWALIAASAATCMTANTPKDATWLGGDFSLSPVMSQQQSRALERLGSRSLMPVSASFAKSATAEKIATAKKYYLVRVGWYSPAPSGTLPPASVRTTVDVASSRTAYVTSFLLTRSEKTSEFAAILTSPVALRRVVRVCGAAE